MPAINIITDFFNITGYAKHGYGIIRALKKLNPETFLETNLPPDWHKMVDDLSFELCSKGNNPTAWQVMITNPLMTQYKLVEPNKGVLPFFVFEGDKAPKQWALLSEKFSRVLVPSEHTAWALMAAGIKKEKIAIVPHGYDPQIFNPEVKTIPQFQSKKFTFLWNKGWSKGEKDRSGFHHVLRAFCAEFKPEENIRLLAHINPVYNRPDWNIENEIAKINISPKEERAEISISTDAWNDQTVAQFYKAGDCFIGVTCADAFNLPVLEAMACGLPVIISTFGGQMDYAGTQEFSFEVKGELQPAQCSDINEKTLYEQTNWLVPDQNELRNRMRAVFELWKQDKKQWTHLSEQATLTAKQWTWENSAQKLLNLVKEMEADNGNNKHGNNKQ